MASRSAVLIVQAVIALAVTACTSVTSANGQGSAGSAPRPSPSATVVTSGPLVTKRAAGLTDISAPGIQIPTGNAQLSFSVGSHDVVITGSDWDTITASSKVAANVGVEFASDFHWTATTRNRFQYLADLIARDESSTNFDPLSIVTNVKGDTVRSTVALYNSGGRPGTLSGLRITLLSQPGNIEVGTGSFFTTADSALLIPARTIAFDVLSYPLIAQPRVVNKSVSETTDFHYDSFSPA